MSARALSSILATIVLATGCAGRLGTPIPMMPSPSGQTASVQFLISIPRATAAQARKPAYVSASTKSATVVVSPGNATTIIDCNTSTLTCSGTVLAPIGSDTFTVRLYDGTGGTGNLLSTGSLTQTIGYQNNAVNVTFNGVVAALSVALNPSMVTSGTSATVAVTVNALDADRNTIVGPGTYSDQNGNPVTVTLTDSDTSGATRLSLATLTQPATGITMSYNGAAISSPTVSAGAPGFGTAKAALAVNSTGPMTAAQINSALQTVQSTYQSLPHTSVESDLAALAAQMTSSGAYTSAVVVDGGIDATFPNGTETLIFADRHEDLGGTFDESAARAPQSRRPLDAPLSPGSAHEVAFLVNELDKCGAFHPARQQAFAAAFTAAGFTAAAGYGVDALDISLENIKALGQGHPIDFLDISTHGMVRNAGTYYLLSTTIISDAALQTYAGDTSVGRTIPATFLDAGNNPCQPTPSFAFTADFLAKYLTFNPGAIVDNTSCWGQSQDINAGLQQLSAVGIGRYYGWTRPVDGLDADESDAFMFDRLLGEQSPSVTGLDQYANQRTPPQRPFSLDDIYIAMQTENRSSPIHAFFSTTGPYTTSGSNRPAYFLVSDFGSELLSNRPIEYGLPSIERLVADENNGALDIFGTFPSTPGTVSIVNSAGTAIPAPSSWKTGAVIVPLPAAGSGAGTFGLVSATSGGIASNAVPLTQWSGQITYNASGPLASWEGDNGSGSFSLQAAFNVNFRADVHPTVVAIDSTPAPQAFAFTNVAGGSSGAFTSGSGNFTSSNVSGNGCSNCGIALGIAKPAPTMVPVATNQNQFFVQPESGPTPPATFSVPSPSPGCNNGQPGPGGSNLDALCAYLYFAVNNAVTCQVTAGNPPYCEVVNGTLSDEIAGDSGTVYLAPSFTLTMDPTTYALTLGATPATLSLDPFGNPGNATATISGTFQVQATPAPMGVSSRSRR